MNSGPALLLDPAHTRAAFRAAPIAAPAEERWPAPVRLLVLVGGAAASWGLTLSLIARIG